MLRFTFRQFTLLDKFYVLLPKMNSPQVLAVARRLQELGFKTSGFDRVRAVKGGVAISIDPRGFCCSNRDLTDVLAPAIPQILAVKKERVRLGSLRRRYFQAKRSGGQVHLRMTPRLESLHLWTALRGAGSCALTPDEQRVYSFLISGSSMASECLADYPTEGCAVKIIGERQYYSCRADPKETAANLRSTDAWRPRNSYLPRSSMLRLSSLKTSDEMLRQVLNDLGEWCYFDVG